MKQNKIPTYSELVNLVEKSSVGLNRYLAVVLYIAYFGSIDSEGLKLINKLLDDNFISL